MAWYPRYYHQWYDDEDVLLRVDFEKEVNGANVEISAQPSPFTIDYPVVRDKLESVRGCGATINLLSTTNLELLDFVGNDPKEWRVKLYKDGTLTWMGYLSRDQYAEPYTESENYPVTLYANNGFGLLEKQRFVQDGGDRYEGISSQWEVIELILGTHWGLMDLVNYIFVGMDTRFAEDPHSNLSTIFHNTYVKMDNFYDEDGNPMTCREVLESILKPYSAYIIQYSNFILIYDIHKIAGGGTQDVGDEATAVFDNNFDPIFSGGSMPSTVDINDSGFYRTGGTLKIVPPLSEFIIRYSKYKSRGMATDITNEDKFVQETGWSEISSGDNFWLNQVESHSDWTFLRNGALDEAQIEGLKHKEGDEPEYLLRILNTNWQTWVDYDYTLKATTSWSAPYIVGNGQTYLKIQGEIKPTSFVNPYDSSTDLDPDHEPDAVSIGINLSIGSMSYDSLYGEWIPDIDNTPYKRNLKVWGTKGGDRATIENWHAIRTLNSSTSSFYASRPNTEESILIRLQDGVSGQLTMSFTGDILSYDYWPQGNGFYIDEPDETEKLRKMYVKDFTFDFVEIGTLESDDNDVEYRTVFDTSYTNNKKEITLNLGNSTTETAVDYGGLMYRDDAGLYRYVASWSRADVTASVEELLLRTLVSNYSSSTLELDLEINNSTCYPSQRMGDGTYLPGVVFMYSGGTIDPTKNSERVTLIEIKQDGNTING